MPPWQGGGNMIEDVTFERIRYQDAPARFEAGTGNIADAAGLLEYGTHALAGALRRYTSRSRSYPAAAGVARIPGV